MRQLDLNRLAFLIDTDECLGAGVIAVDPLDVEALCLFIKRMELSTVDENQLNDNTRHVR